MFKFVLLVSFLNNFLRSELKNDLKTTNIKELKAQNERLSLELSKAFMNDTKILDAIEESEHLGLGKRLEDVSSSDIRFVHSSGKLISTNTSFWSIEFIMFWSF